MNLQLPPGGVLVGLGCDLIEVERRLGYTYELPGGSHYQWICPRCRRPLLALAQRDLIERPVP